MADQIVDLRPILRDIDAVGRAVGAIGQEVSAVRADVSRVAGVQTSTLEELQDLRRRFETFVAANERQRLLQLAETRLGTLKDDLEREYGHYEVVRRSSIGTLQAFDVGNVRNKTVLEVSEELMIQTPRYWLAPALVAIAAWSRDDEDLARKSVQAAFDRDKKKTSLFFALVLRRQNRFAEASRWLRHYFIALDPRSLSREFAVLLESIAQDGFGAEGRMMVLAKMNEWKQLLAEDAELVENQVRIWRSEIEGSRGTVRSEEYPRLTACCPEWSQAREVLECSSAHRFLIEKYSAIRDVETPLSGAVKDRLDDLLETLITEFDEEELPLRREMLYNEALIEAEGDEQRATARVDAEVAALDEQIDILTLQTSMALRPDLFGVSPATQRMSIAACREEFRTAVNRFSLDYRGRWTDVVRFQLGPSHSPAATTLGFKDWETDSSVPQERAEASLSRHWDQTVQRYIDEQTFNYGLMTKEYAVAGIAALFAIFSIGVVGGIVLALAGGGLMWYRTEQRKQQCAAAVANAERLRDAAKAGSTDLYREAVAEWVDAGLVFAEEDPREQEFLDLIGGWPA